jgi:hypothetical protein
MSSLIRVKILLLSQIEIKLGIISASAPSIQSLFHRRSLDRSNAPGFGHVDAIGSGPSKSRRYTELQVMGVYSATNRRKSVCMGSPSEGTVLRKVGITKTMEMTVEFAQLHGSGNRRERFG